MLPIFGEPRKQHFPVYGQFELIPRHLSGKLQSSSVLHEESFSQVGSCRHAEISWNSMQIAMRQTTKTVIFAIFNVDPVLLIGVV